MKGLSLSLSLAGALALSSLIAIPTATGAPPTEGWRLAQADSQTETPPREPEAAPLALPDAKAATGGQMTINQEVIVRFGGDVRLATNETAETVVVFGGDGHVAGVVKDVLVVIGGDANVEGEVRGEVVVVGGSATVSGHIKGELVVVGGSARLLPGARVDGDLVTVGGSVELDPDATVSGGVQQVSVGFGVPDLKWLKQWLTQCVLKLRPLSFQVGWVWVVAGVLFLLYLFTAVVLRQPVDACVRQFEERPATTFLVGLLGILLAPVLIFILMATGVGLLGVPFLFAAMAVAVLFGKVAFFQYVGAALGRLVRVPVLRQPLVAFLAGWVLLTLLSVVPILGFLLMGITILWGFGAALMAVFARSRAERPPSAPGLTPGGLIGPPPAAGAGVATAGMAANFTAAGDPPVIPAGQGLGPVGATATGVPEALAYPRAMFWPRMGAGALDMLLVGVVSSVLPLPMSFLFATVAYFTAMWAWKGTSIGGVVAGLKVVRLDGRPLDWTVALVRSLAAWLSTVALFLGFLWILWDPERQSWHDRIAGTVVVKLPRGTPLLAV